MYTYITDIQYTLTHIALFYYLASSYILYVYYLKQVKNTCSQYEHSTHSQRSHKFTYTRCFLLLYTTIFILNVESEYTETTETRQQKILNYEFHIVSIYRVS